MILTILITVWITCSVIHCAREWARPYSGDFWFFDFLLGPYFIVVDTIDEYRDWKRIKDNQNK